jgi:transposase-like protein
MSKRNVPRYSTSIKLKVIKEIEEKKYSVPEAEKVYGISTPTIYRWIREFGKDHLIGKVVHVRTKDELDRVKKLEQDNAKLEKALARAHLKIFTMENLIEVVEEEYNIELKKSFGSGRSTDVEKK